MAMEGTENATTGDDNTGITEKETDERQKKISEEKEAARKTEIQIESIEKEIRESQELTSEKMAVEELRKGYTKDSNFDKGILYLKEHYRFIRKVRGDGNCYYRAFLYSLSEYLAENKTELDRVVKLVKESIDQLVGIGYDRFALEMFWEEMVELLESLGNKDDNTHKKLNEENSASDYCTWYMRVLTSARLKSDPDRFVHFLEGDHFDIPTFCQREVEPMGKECGMVQVLALAEALGVTVEIEYMDGHDLVGGKLTKHTFGEGPLVLTFLYRPGHYDVLYKE